MCGLTATPACYNTVHTISDALSVLEVFPVSLEQAWPWVKPHNPGHYEEWIHWQSPPLFFFILFFQSGVGVPLASRGGSYLEGRGSLQVSGWKLFVCLLFIREPILQVAIQSKGQKRPYKAIGAPRSPTLAPPTWAGLLGSVGSQHPRHALCQVELGPGATRSVAGTTHHRTGRARELPGRRAEEQASGSQPWLGKVSFRKWPSC